MSVANDLRAAARQRGRLGVGDTWTAQRLFEVVRDMPFGRPPKRTATGAIAAWRGTAYEKHLLLQEAYEDFGLRALLMCALHEFTLRSAPWLPEALRADLDARGPLPAVHHFVRVELADDEWVTVDATWPLSARALGFPANERVSIGRDQTLACDPDELFHVPPGIDAAELTAALVARHVGAQEVRLEDCYAVLARWLDAAGAGAESSQV